MYPWNCYVKKIAGSLCGKLSWAWSHPSAALGGSDCPKMCWEGDSELPVLMILLPGILKCSWSTCRITRIGWNRYWTRMNFLGKFRRSLRRSGRTAHSRAGRWAAWAWVIFLGLWGACVSDLCKELLGVTMAVRAAALCHQVQGDTHLNLKPSVTGLKWALFQVGLFCIFAIALFSV